MLESLEKSLGGATFVPFFLFMPLSYKTKYNTIRREKGSMLHCASELCKHSHLSCLSFQILSISSSLSFPCAWQVLPKCPILLVRQGVPTSPPLVLDGRIQTASEKILVLLCNLSILAQSGDNTIVIVNGP